MPAFMPPSLVVLQKHFLLFQKQSLPLQRIFCTEVLSGDSPARSVALKGLGRGRCITTSHLFPAICFHRSPHLMQTPYSLPTQPQAVHVGDQQRPYWLHGWSRAVTASKRNNLHQVDTSFTGFPHVQLSMPAWNWEHNELLFRHTCGGKSQTGHISSTITDVLISAHYSLVQRRRHFAINTVASCHRAGLRFVLQMENCNVHICLLLQWACMSETASLGHMESKSSGKRESEYRAKEKINFSFAWGKIPTFEGGRRRIWEHTQLRPLWHGLHHNPPTAWWNVPPALSVMRRF